jgi:hypothetical protein
MDEMPGMSGRTQCLVLAAFCSLVILLLMTLIPWQSAVMFGGDEGFEFTKAYLVHQGISLYEPIWNDQPPLHTIITALAFGWLGPEVATSRLVAFGFAFLYLWVLGCLIARDAGWLAGIVGILFALSSPGTLELCVSSMLEVPAMAGGLASALVLTTGERTKSLWRCVFSGVVMGLACQTKLTAVVVLPAILMSLTWECVTPKQNIPWRYIVKCVGGFMVGMVGSFCLVWAFFPAMSYELIWGTHFLEGVSDGTKRVAHFAFNPVVFLEHPEAVVGVVIGVVGLLLKKRRILFPAVLLITVLVVHFVHRPYWSYYYLHFVAPFSWIVAVGMAAFLRGLFSLTGLKSWKAKAVAGIQVLAVSLVVALIVVEGGSRVYGEVERLSEAERVGENKMIQILKQKRDTTEWMYTKRTVLAFHAGIRVIPELAIVPKKRYWAYGFNDKVKFEYLRRYEPELLLLTRRELNDGTFAGFLEKYRKVAELRSLTLFEINEP